MSVKILIAFFVTFIKNRYGMSHYINNFFKKNVSKNSVNRVIIKKNIS